MTIKKILLNHKEYFNTGITKNINFRINQLKKLKEVIIKNEKDILKALYKDLHKSEFEAYATEIGLVYEEINYAIKNIKKWVKPKKVKTPLFQFKSKSYIFNEPYGTVLIISPWNYPFLLLISPLIGAIAAGNCAVLKPSEYSIETTKILSKIIQKNFNSNYISLVQGNKEISLELLNQPFNYIFFTGNPSVGKTVMKKASENLIPITLELGGKSPCIVDKSANIETAAKRIVWGKFINAGQTCVTPDYLLIHKDIKKQLLEKIIKNIKNFYGSNPIKSKDYSRIINEKQFNRLIKLLNKGNIIFGGYCDIKNLYIEPTIIDNVTWEDLIMLEEIFGPILPIIEYKNLNTIINKINERHKPLSLYLFTKDKKVQDKIIKDISYGGGCINDTISHVSSLYLPFGGVGFSGIGSYHGKFSFDLFSHKKSILKKDPNIDFSFPFPPYNKKLHILKKFMK